MLIEFQMSVISVGFCVRKHEGNFLGFRNGLCLDQGCDNVKGIIQLHVQTHQVAYRVCGTVEVIP